MTLTERLKFETDSEHDSLERTPILARQARGLLSQKGYVEILKQLYLIHACLEELLEKYPENPHIAACYQDYHPRRERALADIHFFEPELSSKEFKPNQGTKKLLDFFETIAKKDPGYLLGAFYVLEGSNFGAAFLVNVFQKTYRLEEAGVSYYLGHKDKLKLRWDRFKDALNAAFLDVKDQDEVVAIAQHTFALIREMYLDIEDDKQLAKKAGGH
jgi:heme oxygenase